MAVLLMAAMLLAGCLDVLAEDHETERIADAAAPALPIPLRSSDRHWFLRQQPGFIGAHLTTYGGGPGEALTTIRVARFRDVASARAGFARLTPDLFYRLWGSRMAAAPRSVRSRFPFLGDEIRELEYQPPPSPGSPDLGLTVQLISLRSGTFVLVIESIGVPRDQLPAVAAALVRAVREVPDQQD
ncbi:MAG: hypothetical protein AB7R89_19240 [Dehalococcoidia bacterium]